LLPRDALIATGEFDHADWNYEGRLGWLQRKRFDLVLSLMGEARYPRLLEVGYGSGVLMPELRTRCDALYGVDPHPKAREVEAILSRHGIEATLRSATAAALPFDDAFFDCAVSVSALEYVEAIDRASAELARVLKPAGVLIVVTPGHSALLDLALRVSTGEDPARNYGDRRRALVPALLRHFRLERRADFPPVLGRLLPVYRALRLAPAPITP
jgi:SAM-dependent methyltransferase